MKQNIYSRLLLTLILISGISLGLIAQDNCFQSLKNQGNIALKKSDYATAIQSFQSIIRNCDKATQTQRKEALSLLNDAYDFNQAALKASVERAETKAAEAEKNELEAKKNAVEANAERQKKEVEAINARSSKIAFHASEESDNLAKLTLAYYSKKWLANIDTFSQSSNTAFGEAIEKNYKRVEDSQLGFVNAATLINDTILIRGINGAISIIEKKESKTLVAHQDHILDIIPFKNGFITVSKDNTAKYWETAAKPKFTLAGHQGTVNGAVISPNESIILTYSSDKTAKIWNEEGQLLATLDGHGGAIHDAIFSSDGQYILTRSQNKEVGLWDNKGKLITKKMHDAFVYDVAISSDNQLIVSSTADGQIHLWNTEGKMLSKKAHDNAVFEVEIASNNQHFLTTGADKSVKLWDKSGKLIQTFSSPSSINNASFIGEQNQILIAAGKEISIYNFSGKKEQEFSHESLISTVELAKNGTYLLVGTYDNVVKLWSTKGFELLSLNPFNDQIIGLDFSESEEYILAYSQDGVVALCPTPNYIYQLLEKQPPVMTKALKDKYGINE